MIDKVDKTHSNLLSVSPIWTIQNFAHHEQFMWYEYGWRLNDYFGSFWISLKQNSRCSDETKIM